MKRYLVIEKNYGFTSHCISTRVLGNFATANQAYKFANKYQRSPKYDYHCAIVVEPKDE